MPRFALGFAVLLAACAVVALAATEAANTAAGGETAAAGPAVRALIESCSGCSLNRLHEVRKFVKQQVQEFENVEVNYITGRKPVIHFYDANDVKIETVELSPLNNDQCLELLTSRGFKRKAAAQHADL